MPLKHFLLSSIFHTWKLMRRHRYVNIFRAILFMSCVSVRGKKFTEMSSCLVWILKNVRNILPSNYLNHRNIPHHKIIIIIIKKKKVFQWIYSFSFFLNSSKIQEPVNKCDKQCFLYWFLFMKIIFSHSFFLL